MNGNVAMRAGAWAISVIAASVGLAGCGNAGSAQVKTESTALTPEGLERKRSMTAIEIEAEGKRWTAQISDTPAGRAFLAQLPLTLTLKDYAGTEKIADLPRPLTRTDEPSAITPVAGDVTFYAPWGNLAIFYKDGHRSPGLIPLGRLDGNIELLAAYDGVAVTIRRTAR